jgi:hypothetical protein
VGTSTRRRGFGPDQNAYVKGGTPRHSRLAARVVNRRSFCPDMPEIPIHELEAAINFWRNRSPSSGDEPSLCDEASALSRPYALLIVQRATSMPSERLDPKARAAWEAYERIRAGLSD